MSYSERWDLRPWQSREWIDVTAEPDFRVERNSHGGFTARDYANQRQTYFKSLSGAKAWCERQLAERDK